MYFSRIGWLHEQLIAIMIKQGTRNKLFSIIELTNSILWFSMDSLWMLDEIKLASILILPTVITGLFAVFEKMDFGNVSISMAVNAWLGMNIFWMLEMMFVAKICFLVGISLVLLSITFSRNLRVLYRFKRFRK